MGYNLFNCQICNYAIFMNTYTRKYIYTSFSVVAFSEVGAEWFCKALRNDFNYTYNILFILFIGCLQYYSPYFPICFIYFIS